jgi:hypothetical protein
LATRVPGAVGTNKQKKFTLKVNTFGCVRAGGRCRGRDKNCCSGVCNGKRPRNGKRDRSRCQARSVGGCPEGLMSFGCGGAVSLECSIGGGEGVCHTATGAAGFCGRGFECAACGHDRDCQRLDLFGPDAACVVCPTCVAEGGTACVGAAG